MRHLPRGAPKPGRRHEIDHALATEGDHIEANAFQRFQLAGYAQSQRIRPPGLLRTPIGESPHFANPVGHQVDGGLRRIGLTTHRLAPPIEFEAFVIIVLHHFLDLGHHQIAHLRLFKIQAGAITRFKHRWRVATLLQSHLRILQQGHIEETAVDVLVPVVVVHADRHPRGDPTPPAGRRGFSQPIHSGIHQIQIHIHERHDPVDEALLVLRLGRALTDGMATKVLAITPHITVENGWDHFARIPSP